jgi:glucose-1-phosphate thymidylyltransferase
MSTSPLARSARRVVGVVPAAGRATRLGALACSKEVLPVGYRRISPGGGVRPKAVSQYLLEKMRAAGAREIYIVIRDGKWDIPAYYRDGAEFGLDIAYLVADEPLGPPFTLDHARPFTRDATVLFGFPDILFDAELAFATAVARLEQTRADVVLGVFDPHPHEAFDTVVADPDARILRIDRAGLHPTSKTWLFAVWNPTFTEFLHTAIGRWRTDVEAGEETRREWPVGATIQSAIEDGLHVDSVEFPAVAYTDVGKPESLARSHAFPGVWNGIDERPAP